MAIDNQLLPTTLSSNPLRLELQVPQSTPAGDAHIQSANPQNLRALSDSISDIHRPVPLDSFETALKQITEAEQAGFNHNDLDFKLPNPQAKFRFFEFKEGHTGDTHTKTNPRGLMNQFISPFADQIQNIQFKELLEKALAISKQRIEAVNLRLVEPLLTLIRTSSSASKELRNKLLAAAQTIVDDAKKADYMIDFNDIPSVSLDPIK